MSNFGDCPSGTGALVNQAPAGLGPDGLRSPVGSFDLSAFMRREGIAKIELFPRLFSVVLMDGRLGIAPTVGEALEKAKRPDAENLRRAA